MVAARFTLLRANQDEALLMVVRHQGGPLDLDSGCNLPVTAGMPGFGPWARAGGRSGDVVGISFSPSQPPKC